MADHVERMFGVVATVAAEIEQPAAAFDDLPAAFRPGQIDPLGIEGSAILVARATTPFGVAVVAVQGLVVADFAAVVVISSAAAIMGVPARSAVWLFSG